MIMLSIKGKLGSLKLKQALPTEFDPSRGLSQLFPHKRPINLRNISNFEFEHSSSVKAENVTSQLTVISTGTGYWKFTGKVWSSSLVIPDNFTIGFGFKYVENSVHVWAGQGDAESKFYGGGEDHAYEFHAYGIDQWIAENWQEAFPHGVTFFLNVDGSTVKNVLKGMVPILGGSLGIIPAGFTYLASQGVIGLSASTQ